MAAHGFLYVFEVRPIIWQQVTGRNAPIFRYNSASFLGDLGKEQTHEYSERDCSECGRHAGGRDGVGGR
jgi:hypothetical protein